jgi:hypothetical protein
MRNFILVLIGISALAFILAVISALVGGHVLGIWAETYSRACSNIALIAIALAVSVRGEKG